MNVFNKPNSETAEITLIGTGGGYGESVVIHLGNDDWVVIDSFKNPVTGKILPLEYLEKIKVDLAHVRLIICTHWHDDHIKGISEIFEACKNATFCFAKFSSLKQFFVFLGLGELKGEKLSQSCTEEFNKCIDLINANGRKVVYSSIDRMVLKTDSNNGITILSPADATHDKFEKKLGELIKIGRDPNRELLPRSPNHLSIATLLSIGQHYALLGADLEITTDKNEGWANIIENCNAIKSIKSSFFKIPHHGSSTGYYELV